MGMPSSILFLYHERKPGRLSALWGGGAHPYCFSFIMEVVRQGTFSFFLRRIV